ncbi:MAG: DUF3300 domain-containing protein [Rhodospirillales bacterium]|nr:DUF3300 domain-containing protein [Rhodospirillales bacterium]
MVLSLGLAAGSPSVGSLAQVPGPYAPAAPPQAPAGAAQANLETLVAPVALYPDELLAVVLQAAMEPVQVVQAGRFLERYAKDKNLKPNANWTEPVKILVNYPEVLQKLNDDLDWTEQLGLAVRAQQGDVMAAVQQFRRRVAAAGNLRSDDKLTVYQDGGVYVIESAIPQQIPVPVYDPQVVIVQQPAPPAPVYIPTPYPAYYDPYPGYAAAATGFFFGALTTAWAMDWYNHGIDEDDIKDFQQSRQQSLQQRQQSRQDAAGQRQQARQDSSTQRQQGRQDARGERQDARPDRQPQPTPRQGGGQQDLGAILSGERPGQRPGQGGTEVLRPGQGGAPGVAQRPAQGGAYQPGQRPGQGAGAGGGLQPTQRPAQGGFQQGGFQQQPQRDFGGGARPGQMPAGGGAYAGARQSASAGSFSYGSGRSAVQASDRGSQSRSFSGGGGGGRAGGGGGRGGRR